MAINQANNPQLSIPAGSGTSTYQPFFLNTEETGSLAEKILNVVDKFGKYILFNDTLNDYNIKCTPPYKYTRKFQARSIEMGSVTHVLMPAYDMTYIPLEGHKVTMDGQEWRISAVEHVYAIQKIGAYVLRLVLTGNSKIVQSSVQTKLDKRIIPKVQSLISKYGISSNFKHWTTRPAFDPTTREMSGGVLETTENIPIIPFEGYDNKLIDGGIIQDGDKKSFVRGNIGISVYDTTCIQVGNIDWEVIGSYPHYSGNQIALFELHLRQLL